MTEEKELTLKEKDIKDLDDICDECNKEDESVSQNLILTDLKFVNHAEYQRLYFQFKYC